MRTIIAAATVGLLIGGALVVVIALAGLAARAWHRGNHQADQIFGEEIGGPGPNKGLGPKDLAMDLRVHGDPTVYRTADTKPGETP